VERLQDASKQDAEIAAYFRDHDKVSCFYQESGRIDLCLQLFMRLGLWARVEALVKVIT
jgi:hypothetical protein